MTKRYAPAADRNKQVIADTLKRFSPFSNTRLSATCLEIGSGTGQHCAHFATAFPHVTFQPSEYAGGPLGATTASSSTLASIMLSITAYTAGMANVQQPIEIDASLPAMQWPCAPSSYDGVFCANVAHIAPFAVTQGIFSGAKHALKPDGMLFLYGPFKVDGQHTAVSNEAFDLQLREQNSAWRVRDATELGKIAMQNGLKLHERCPMPANNFMLVFCKTASASS